MQELGKTYKETFTNFQPEPPQESWMQLQERISRKSTIRRRRIKTTIAIATVFTAGSVLLGYFYFTPQEITPSTTVSTEVQKPSSPAIQRAETLLTENQNELQDTKADVSSIETMEKSDSRVTKPILSEPITSLPSNTYNSLNAVFAKNTMQPNASPSLPVEPIAIHKTRPSGMEKGERLSASDTTQDRNMWTERYQLKIPNAFTPDETTNDKFLPAPDEVSNYDFRIYNRFGGEVFRTNNISEGWNGTYNGSSAPSGTYVYIIFYTDRNGEKHEQKGVVNLIR